MFKVDEPRDFIPTSRGVCRHREVCVQTERCAGSEVCVGTVRGVCRHADGFEGAVDEPRVDEARVYTPRARGACMQARWQFRGTLACLRLAHTTLAAVERIWHM